MWRTIHFSLFSTVLFFACNSLAQTTGNCPQLLADARQLMLDGKYKDAIPLIDSCLALNPASAQASNLRGCATIYQGPVNDAKNDKLAILFYDNAIQTDSTVSTYYNNRGWAYQFLENLTKSYSDFKRAVLLDSNEVNLQGNILRNLWLRNKNKEALEYSNQLVRRFPQDGYAYHVRGNLKRDFLHKYPEGNKDIKLSEELGWRQVMLIY